MSRAPALRGAVWREIGKLLLRQPVIISTAVATLSWNLNSTSRPMHFPFFPFQFSQLGSLALRCIHFPAWPGFLTLLCGLLLPVPALAAPTVNVLVTELGGIYEETADSLSSGLRQAGWSIKVSTPERYSANGGDLTVAIGTRALEAALAQPRRPVLSLLVPRSTYERMAAGKKQVSALYLDQPLERQLQLLGLALPDLKNAGVLLGPASRELKDALQTAGQGSGIQVNTALIDNRSDLHAALNDLAAESQAFILLPDPLVANRNLLQNFFLHTYRLKKPVMAYSEPLSNSGAILSLYATAAQQGEEAAGWIRDRWSNGGGQLGEPRYPKRFTISINSTVARSLNIALPSAESLRRKLEGML